MALSSSDLSDSEMAHDPKGKTPIYLPEVSNVNTE